MGDAGQQFLPAFLFLLGLLHRRFQPPCHFVEVLADRLKFVRLPIGDLVGQVPVPDLADAFRQGFQRVGDFPEYKSGQEPVGEKNDKADQDDHQKSDPNHPRFQAVLGEGHNGIGNSEQIVTPVGGNFRPEQVVFPVGNRPVPVQRGQCIFQIFLRRSHSIPELQKQIYAVKNLNGQPVFLRKLGQMGLHFRFSPGIQLRQPVCRQLRRVIPDFHQLRVKPQPVFRMGEGRHEKEEQSCRQRQNGEERRNDNHQDVGKKEPFFDGHAFRPLFHSLSYNFKKRLN